jgi:hypothetical protein
MAQDADNAENVEYPFLNFLDIPLAVKVIPRAYDP